MRLTLRGAALAVGSALLVVAGFLFGYAELALLGTAGVIAVLCAVGYAAWRPRLTVDRRAEPDRVARGEASTVTLTVGNASRLLTATLIAYDRCGGARIPVPLLRLRPGRDTVVDYPVPTRRRGVVDIGPLRVTRTDPLGLATVARTHGGTSRVWVHPRSYPLAAVPAGITRSMDGRFDRVPHGSITFASLREYVVGDELRHVHWRTSARVGELMVREHHDTSLPRIVVVLDNRAGSWPDPEAFEAACEAAASVVVAAAREDLTVFLSQVCGSPSGAAVMDRLAEVLLEPDAGGGLRDTTTRLRQRRIADTLVYLTGAGGIVDLGLIAGLRGPYPAVVVGVLGADTPAPSTVQGVLVLDAADGPEFAAGWDGVRSW